MRSRKEREEISMRIHVTEVNGLFVSVQIDAVDGHGNVLEAIGEAHGLREGDTVVISNLEPVAPS